MSYKSLLYLLSGITIAWLLLHYSHEAWRHRSHRIRSPSTRTPVQQQDMRRLPKAQIGWFWLILSWHVEHSAALLDSEALRRGSRSSSRRHKKSIDTASNLLKAFYTVGALCVLLALLGVPLYLLWSLYQTLTRGVGLENADIKIHEEHSGLLIPGITVPARDAFALIVAGLVAIVWHEAGHAITAIL